MTDDARTDDAGTDDAWTDDANRTRRSSLPTAVTPRNRPTPRRLDRFRLDALIGEGGMGKVYEAWDPRLERQVAMKVLHEPDATSRQRFMREARLQGSISHPGVCPVFEVGQAEGQPYIVMPRLQGQTLDTAAAHWPLEQKLGMMRRVAEAVHAAHRSGLVHRDIKPSNIMVETPDDGPPRPVVLDFGIARQLSGDGPTRIDQMIGTPAYMAPEQIDGELGRLDRRADVYALGATLYRLLAGRPPFVGHGASLLLEVVRNEPAPLRQLDIPLDVEAIVLKCLEKQKRHRYDSALALAEDIGRYLDGQPVMARRIGRRIRLLKWLRRHRAAVRVATVAAGLLTCALAWGLWTRQQASGREQLARQFSAQVEEVEALVRYSNLAPLHDVRPDRAELRRRMAEIRGVMAGADDTVRALGHHALGQGHLALDEPELARQHISAAWDLGQRSPEVAADLGLALSEVYRERLAALERVQDPAAQQSLREQLRQRLAKTFGDPGEQREQLQRSFGEPARRLLSQGRVLGRPEDAILEPLILFHGGRFEEAIESLEALPARPPWAYEPLTLEGDIRRSWAVALDGEGRREDARAQLERSRQVYGQAMKVAESDASVRRDDAQSIYLLLTLGLAHGDEAMTLLSQGLDTIQQALVANPDDIRSWLWRARLHRLAAQRAEAQDIDPGPHLDEVVAASERALALDKTASAAWLEIGRAHWRRGRWLRDRGPQNHGTAAESALRRAAAAFDRVAPEERDYGYYTSLGVLRMTLAGQRSAAQQDATEDYRAAVAAYQAAAERHSAPFAALTNLGVSLLNASGLPGTEPQELIRQAIATFERARAFDPDHMVPWYYLGLSRLRLAQGGNPASGQFERNMAERAVDALERAVEIAPEAYQALAGLGEALHFQALDAHDRGGDPAPFFERSRATYVRALELAPDHPLIQLNLAWSYYFEGKFEVRQGAEGRAHLARAEALCRQTLANKRRNTALLCLASVLRLTAEQRIQDSLDPMPSLQEARTLFEEILAHDPENAEAHRSLGRLDTLEAAWRIGRGENPTPAFDSARRALDRALQLEPDIALFWLADARWHLTKARWLKATGQPVAPALAAVEESARQARRLRPTWLDAERLSAEVQALSQVR